jgi:hypothetical protein
MNQGPTLRRGSQGRDVWLARAVFGPLRRGFAAKTATRLNRRPDG